MIRSAGPLSWMRTAVFPSPLAAVAVCGATVVAGFYGFGVNLQQPRFTMLQFKRFTDIAAYLSVLVALLSSLHPLSSCVVAVGSEIQTARRIISHSCQHDLKDVIRRLGGVFMSMAHTGAVTVCSALLFGGSIPVFLEGLQIPVRGVGLVLSLIHI